MDISKITSFVAQVENKYKEMVVIPVKEWLKKHPYVHAISIFACQIFRAISMLALVNYLPYSLLTNCLISLGASVLYNLTVEEVFCNIYRFAIPGCLGGMSMHLALPQLAALAQGVALQTFADFSRVVGGLVPLCAYLGYTIWICYDEANKRALQGSSCCHRATS